MQTLEDLKNRRSPVAEAIDNRGSLEKQTQELLNRNVKTVTANTDEVDAAAQVDAPQVLPKVDSTVEVDAAAQVDAPQVLPKVDSTDEVDYSSSVVDEDQGDPLLKLREMSKTISKVLEGSEESIDRELELKIEAARKYNDIRATYETAKSDFGFRTLENEAEESKQKVKQKHIERESSAWLGFTEGLKATANNVGDAYDFVMRQEKDPWFELRDDLTEVEELWKMGGEVVGFIAGAIPTTLASAPVGVAGLAFAGTYNALRFARVAPQAAKWIAATAKWVPGEVVAMQLLMKPEDERLIDMMFSKTEAPSEEIAKFKKDPLNIEGHQRLMNLAKDSVEAATFNAVLGKVGQIWMRSRAAKLKNSRIQVSKEISGQGNSNRSQVAALEDMLYSQGMTIKEIKKRVRVPYEAGKEVSEIALENGTDVATATKRAIEDRDVAKRIMGRHLTEDVSGRTPMQALSSTTKLSKVESKTVKGFTALDDMSEKLMGRKIDEEIKINKRLKNTKTKTGLLNKVLGSDSAVSTWMDLTFKPIFGFDSFKGLKNLGKATRGYDITAKGLLEAYKDGVRGIASTSGALAEDLLGTSQTRIMQFFSAGDGYMPTISSTFDDVSETALRLDGFESFGNLLKRNGVTDTEASDILDYMTAKAIQMVSVGRPKKLRKLHHMYDGEQYKKWLALGENRSANFYNTVDDLRNFLQAPLKYEYQHGLKSADDLKRILAADVDVDGKSWYFPKEALANMGVVDKTVKNVIGKNLKTKKGIKGIKTGNTGSKLKTPQERLLNLFSKSIVASETNKVKQAMFREIETLRNSADPARKQLADDLAVRLNSSEWKSDMLLKKQLRDEVKLAIKEGSTENIDPKLLKKLELDADVSVEDLIKANNGIRSNLDYDVVFHDGIPMVYKVKDPAIKQSLDALGPQKFMELDTTGKRILGGTLAITKTLTKIKSSLITKTPTFWIPAQLREMISSSMFSTMSNIPGITYLKGLTRGGKIMQEAMDGGFSTSNTRFSAATDQLFAAANSTDSIQEKLLANMLMKQSSFLRKASHNYSDMVNRTEVSAKLGEIMGALEMGMTPREAAFMGNQLMNFSRRSSSSTINLIADHMLFLKPSAIGIGKMGETVLARPKLAATMISGYVATDMAIDRMNSLYPESKSFPEWSTMINTLVPNLDDWSQFPQLVQAAINNDPSMAPPLHKNLPFFTIFGAHEVATVSKLTKNFAYLAADAFSGESTTNDTITRAVGRFFKGTFGVYGTAPDILVPFLRVGLTGKDQFGNLIVPNSFGKSGDVTTQYNAKTRPLAVSFSGLLKKFNIDAQPNNLDFLLNWALPGVGELALNMLDGLVGETQLTKKGGRSKTANPAKYFMDALKGRIMVGHGELSNAKATIYNLQNSLYDIQKNLQTQGGRDSREVYSEEIHARLVKIVDGNEVLMRDVFPIVDVTTKELQGYNQEKVRLLNRTFEFESYTDEQAVDHMEIIDKQSEEIARGAIDYLVKYDLIGAAELLGNSLLRDY